MHLPLLVIVLTIVSGVLLHGAEPHKDTQELISWLFEEGREVKDVPFPAVIHAATGRKVIPLNASNSVDGRLLSRIGRAMDQVLAKMNGSGSSARQKQRINEVSSLFEAAIKSELNAVEGFSCDYARTASGAYQRSGYPDLRLLDKVSGRVLYVDPKLYQSESRTSSFRTFYFEPKKETSKVLEDAHHLVIGFEHVGQKDGSWNFVGWELVDLSNFKLRLKAEFQASNRDLYRAETVLQSSKTPKR